MDNDFITQFIGAIVNFLFSLLAAVVSIVLAPVDLLINAIIPQATDAVKAFFGTVVALLDQFGDFLDWFFYVLGISQATWTLMITVALSLLLIWIFLFPFKLIMSTFRGMKE